MNPQEIDNLSENEIGKLFPVVLSKPNPKWKLLYKNEKKELIERLGRYALRIEHIGSTAIPNILSKPTIDILVEIPDNKEIENQISTKMKSLGYYFVHRTDRKPPYLMFIKGVSVKGVTGQTYHIHMAKKDHPIWDKVYFRDYLIQHQDLAIQYENLKCELAKKHRNNRDGYTDGKKEFVMRITQEAKEKYE